MFRPRRLYRFKVNRDVAFEVIKAFYVPEKTLWKLKISWWNIGNCHDPWRMGVDQNIEILAWSLKDRLEEINTDFRTPATEYTSIYYGDLRDGEI